jgi:hypothetical protein
MASCVPCDFLVVAFVQLNDPISREGSLPVSRRRNGSEHCGHPDRKNSFMEAASCFLSGDNGPPLETNPYKLFRSTSDDSDTRKRSGIYARKLKPPHPQGRPMLYKQSRSQYRCQNGSFSIVSRRQETLLKHQDALSRRPAGPSRCWSIGSKRLNTPSAWDLDGSNFHPRKSGKKLLRSNTT